jgi:D-aminoacyl-tRNA deacylase
MANSSALRYLNANPVHGFDVCLEVTHHGPTNLKKPLVFIEVGSTEKEWGQVNACAVAADTIMNLSLNGKGSEIAFGGPHYAPKFTKLCLEGRNIGHICPKYYLDTLDENLFKQMVEKTVPKPSKAIIDKKGVKGRHKKIISELAAKFDLETELV